jgi:hypothetical protein
MFNILNAVRDTKHESAFRPQIKCQFEVLNITCIPVFGIKLHPNSRQEMNKGTAYGRLNNSKNQLARLKAENVNIKKGCKYEFTIRPNGIRETIHMRKIMKRSA